MRLPLDFHGSTVGLTGCGAVSPDTRHGPTTTGAQVVVYDLYIDAGTLPPGMRIVESLGELLSVLNVLTLQARLTPGTPWW